MCSVTSEVSVCVSVSLRLWIFARVCLAGCCRSVFALWGCWGQNVCCCTPFHVSFTMLSLSLSLTYCLSLSFCFQSSSGSLSGLFCHLFQIPLSLSLFTLFFYPFIVTPGILCPVLFPSLHNQHMCVIAWMLCTFSELGFCSHAIIQLVLVLFFVPLHSSVFHKHWNLSFTVKMCNSLQP